MEQMTYEHAMSEIQRIIENMENENQNIENIISDVKYVSKLIKFCKNKLYSIENELNTLLENE